MALSIVKRPRGYHNYTTVKTGTFTSGSSSVTLASHGMATGDRVYVYTGQAIGFWRIEVVDGNTFKLTDDSESGTGTYFTFVGSGTFSFYNCVAAAGHFWNAVHLPIVYRLLSTSWPNNSVDTARTVSSFANDNGFVKLTLSGSLLASLSELEFLKITGIQESGVYQIITWYSTSVVTINMPYYSNLAFGGASVIYYYNNYRAKIRLYAGLTSSHSFVGVKPYTLVCERELVPDSSGYITYNCSEDLKAYLNNAMLKNDPNQGSMPLSLDAFTQFYITYAEAYDYSAGGYGLLDFVGSYVSDLSSFEGYAVNNSLPFKNIHSGSLSQYVYGGTSSTLLKFLTPSLYPVHANNYFDISFVNQFGTALQIYIERYRNSSIFSSGYTAITSNGIGVYRYPITLSSTEDRVDLSLYLTNSILAFASWENYDTGTSWSTTPQVSLGPAVSSKYYRESFIGTAGTVVSFDYSITVNKASGSYLLQWTVYLLDATGAISDTIGGVTVTSNGTYTGTVSLTTTKPFYYLAFRASTDDSFATGTVLTTVNSLSVTSGYSINYRISEIKTLTVDTTCYSNCIDISWLNYLGGFDYWRFRGYADYGNDITQTISDKKNILPNWPRSYGEGADTISREVSRTSKQTIVLRAENLTADQVNDLYRVKLSPLVQIVNSATDRRTVIPDKSSFVHYPQANKLFTFSFTITYTDDNPVQSL